MHYFVPSGISFEPKGRGPSGEDFAGAPATSNSFLYGPDRHFAALRAGEAKRLAEHIPGQQCATIFKGRRRTQERWLSKRTLLKRAWYLWRTN